eukprot:5359569-Amphidinium_carterae.1
MDWYGLLENQHYQNWTDMLWRVKHRSWLSKDHCVQVHVLGFQMNRFLALSIFLDECKVMATEREILGIKGEAYKEQIRQLSAAVGPVFVEDGEKNAVARVDQGGQT